MVVMMSSPVFVMLCVHKGGMSMNEGTSPLTSKLCVFSLNKRRTRIVAVPDTTTNRSILSKCQWSPRVIPGTEVEIDVCPVPSARASSLKAPRWSACCVMATG